MPRWAAGLVVVVAVAAVAGALAGVARSDEAPFPHPSGPVDVAGPINTAFPGLTTFRGNASRSYYGQGPVPTDPVKRWTFPADGQKLCAMSAETQTGPKKLPTPPTMTLITGVKEMRTLKPPSAEIRFWKRA